MVRGRVNISGKYNKGSFIDHRNLENNLIQFRNDNTKLSRYTFNETEELITIFRIDDYAKVYNYDLKGLQYISLSNLPCTHSSTDPVKATLNSEIVGEKHDIIIADYGRHRITKVSGDDNLSFSQVQTVVNPQQIYINNQYIFVFGRDSSKIELAKHDVSTGVKLTGNLVIDVDNDLPVSVDRDVNNDVIYIYGTWGNSINKYKFDTNSVDLVATRDFGEKREVVGYTDNKFIIKRGYDIYVYDKELSVELLHFTASRTYISAGIYTDRKNRNPRIDLTDNDRERRTYSLFDGSLFDSWNESIDNTKMIAFTRGEAIKKDTIFCIHNPDAVPLVAKQYYKILD